MHTDSIYAATRNYSMTFPQLQGVHQADVTVIGSGITGVSAALELAEKGYRVVVVEAQVLSWGASGRSGGQIIAGAGDHADTMIDLLGLEDARKAFDVSLEAMELIKQRVKKYQIECDLTLGQAEVASKASHVKGLEEMTALYDQTFRYPVQMISADEVAKLTGSEAYFGGCYDPRGGHIHPMNYTLGLIKAAAAAGVKFFEHSPVTDIQHGKKSTVFTEQGSVVSDYLVVATNAYLDKLIPDLARYILPVGSYICATEPVPDSILPDNPAIVDSKYLLSYFRKDADGRLLWGGRTGLTRHEPTNLREVIKGRILHAYPQLQDTRIEKSWGGNIAVTMNRMPQFGKLAANAWYIHGYSGHGIAMAGIGGKMIAEAVSGQTERFDLFACVPHKAYPGGTWLRAPGLAAAMVYFQVRDMLS